MDRQIVFLVLLLLNTIFWLGVWHMNLNFMAGEKFGQKITEGVFHIKTEDAYRYSEYISMAAFILTDVLFIWAFLK